MTETTSGPGRSPGPDGRQSRGNLLRGGVPSHRGVGLGMPVSCDMPPMPVSAGAAISPVVSAGGASAAGFSPHAASTRIADIKSSFFIGYSLTG